MKKKDIPQDDDPELYQGKFGDGMLKYVVDENDNYISAVSKGWEPEITVLHQALDELNVELDEIKAAVKDRMLSPIAYYAKLKRMDLSVLSSYVGIWKWKVKRHFNPIVFDKLNDATLEKYSRVFEITVLQLKNYNL